MKPFIRRGYWTPPANVRKAQKEAAKAIDFFATLVPELEDKKINDGLYEVFRTSFDETFLSFLKRLIRHISSSEDFQGLHETARTYSELVRWIAAAEKLEEISLIRKKLEEFFQEASEMELRYGEGDYRSIDLTKLSERETKLIGEEYWDYEEYGSFDKVIPMLRAVVLLPQYLDSYETYLKYLNYKMEYSRRQRELGGEPKPEVEDLEIVWHTTTAYPAILKGGFKTKEELGGEAAGLGGAVSGISFTAQLDLAEEIEQALRDAVEVMQGPNTLEAVLDWARSLGISEKEMKWDDSWNHYGILDSKEQEESMKKYRPDDLKYYSPQDNLRSNSMWELFQWALVVSEEKGHRVNPVFFGVDPELFKKLDPKNIGIVEAVIDTTDPSIEYLQSMEEWRVPIKSILSYGPVGSQTKKEKSAMTDYLKFRGAVYRKRLSNISNDDRNL